MEADKKLETLEQEFRLIKGEVKETLGSLRDYLVTVKLPLPRVEEAEMLGGIGDGEKSTMEGNLNLAPGAAPAGTAPAGATPATTPTAPSLGPDPSPPTAPTIAREIASPPPAAGAPAEPTAEVAEASAAAPAMPDEEAGEIGSDEPAAPANATRAGQEPAPAVPQVNLLANLIRWVAHAKREISDEQLPVLLEVYGISGYLSPELKEVILHLADITEPQAADAGAADVWSRLTLELHGILTGGEAPLYPIKPFWKGAESEGLPDETEEAEANTAGGEGENKPLMLKLVLTGGNSQDREFNINLTSETGNDNS